MKSALLLCSVVLCHWALLARGQASWPDVEIGPGSTLRPVDRMSRDGKVYRAYQGIPFAKPPVGDLRFRAPEKYEWNNAGVFHANQTGPFCLHYEAFVLKKPIGVEDCLKMNVYVGSKDKPVEGLPVMVWFHNGAYMWGSGSQYAGDYFMDEPVILVIANYRIGILGFLNAGVEEAQGNMGFKDQVLVLQWIQENIEKFGGNKNLVTAFGDLAGGASSHLHMYAPMSKGLIHRAISQGGTTLCAWGYNRHPARTVKQVAAFRNIPDNNMTLFVEELRKVEAEDLVATIPKLFEWDTNPVTIFGPTVETAGKEDSKFLATTPYDLIQKKPVNNVPWIQGANSDVGLLAAFGTFLSSKLEKEIDEDWRRIGPLFFFFKDTAFNTTEAADLIRKKYFRDDPIGKKTYLNFTDLVSHRMFYHGNRKSILNHIRVTESDPKPVYLYYLNKEVSNSIVRLAENPRKGATEGDELQYLFNHDDYIKWFKYINSTAEAREYTFSKELIRLWVHFAKNGDTTNYKWQGTTDLKWEPVDRAAALANPKEPIQGYLYLNDKPSISVEPLTKDLIEFWDTLPLNEDEKDLTSLVI